MILASAALQLVLADAPAVVLEDRQVLTSSKTKTTRERTVRLKILARKGFAYADQVIHYDKNASELTRFEARTILPDGRVVEVPSDLKQDVVAWKNDEVEFHGVFFTFPAVEEGAVLEWAYEISHSRLLEKVHWQIQREIPVLETRFVSRFTKDVPSAPWLRMTSRAPAEAWCKEEKEPSSAAPAELRVVGEMVCRDIPASPDEERAAPSSDAIVEGIMVHHFLMVANLADRIRKAVNEEWSERLERCTRKHAQADVRARQIVEGAADEKEKIDRIFRFVVENVATRAGSDEDLCATVDEVLLNAGGTTDEVVFLTLMLLRAAGVRTSLLVVADRSEGVFTRTLPDRAQYQHLLLEVGSAESRGYLDPSCKFCMAGAPDWRYCGEGSGGVRVTPGKPDPEDVTLNGVPANVNAEIIRQSVTLEPDGSARVRGSVEWRVQADVSIRRRMEDLTEAGRKELFLEGMTGEIEDVVITVMDPQNVRENMHVDFEFRQRDLAVPAEGLLLVRPPDVFSRNLSLPLQETRRLPVWWPYARSVRSQTVFSLSPGTSVLLLPEDLVLVGPGLRFEAGWTKGEDEVVWRALLTVSRTSIRPEDYPAAREFAAKLWGAVRQGIVLKQPPLPTSLSSATERKSCRPELGQAVQGSAYRPSRETDPGGPRSVVSLDRWPRGTVSRALDKEPRR